MESGVEELLTKVEGMNDELRGAAKKIKRRLPESHNTPITFSSNVQTDMAEHLSSMDKVLRLFRLVSTAASQLLAVMEGHQQSSDDVFMPVEQLNEVMMKSIEKLYGKADEGSYAQLNSVVAGACRSFKHISVAMENGEYDFDGTPEKTCMPPVVHRASAVKGEFAEVDNLKEMVERKEGAVMELQLQVKNKHEDLGQSVLKVQVLEKKLEVVHKEADDRIDRIQQKLDETTMALKQSEKEHEDSVDALQADIDALETEKAELQKKLKELSKKSLFAGLAKQLASPETADAIETPVKEGGMAARQIACQRELIRSLNVKVAELSGQKMLMELQALPLLDVPQGGGEDEEVVELKRRGKQLMKQSQKLLLPRLIDLTKLKKGVKPPSHLDPFKQLEARKAEMVSLQRQVSHFKDNVATKLSTSHKGGKAVTDFGAFVTPSYQKLLHHHTKVAASITIPTPGQSRCVPLEVTPLQFNQLHSRLSSF